ncbi:glycosyl hydrolase family 3 N terminal domain-containing protein [Xylaria bambusicola]|uniref:glycosyl hydrolase family 3 N terminal domain-containing protein n=1 Tax=Xylaria bambusicola TaxID=326684 RepID=UPI00200858D4|nr:glycosyl hydrolase family 3 N terminal domain-containing protein [Xylaria bambusicola]KAI0520874.1 glycosyl hydrolase family 3 N terminal domain-containing protein [Xylaria bambusicola]
MMRVRQLVLTFALLVVGDAASSLDADPIPTSPVFYPSPWSAGGPDGWDAAYQRAHEFVSKLTLLEKVNLTTGTGNQANLCTGNTGSIPRLGFRELCLQDGPVGIRYTDLNSAFPAGINAAATWSRSLMRKRGEALGAEFRDKGIDVLLGPVVGPLGRDPAGGRNFEGFGPDPYLAGVAVAETVKGTQGAGVVASVKHFILNEQEHFRGGISSNIDDKTMHEVYLWPFADAVRAGVGSVMCSYNKINNTYACENSYVLNHLLKDELGFQGFVVSDWGGQHSTEASVFAGLDMTMPGDGVRNSTYGSYWGPALTEAALSLDIAQVRLDDMVVRIMAAFYKVGRDTKQIDINYSSWTNATFGPRYWHSKTGNTTVNKHVDVQGDHAELIREIGAKSIVLLKNENGALPLKRPISLAIIGEDAQDNPGGPNACVDRICNVGTLAMGWGSATAEFPYLISPATAIEKQARTDRTLFSNIKTNWDLGAARAAASNSSTAIVFVNANSGEGYQTLDGNFGDRKNLTLWNGGDELIAAVASVNPNTIVVIHSVGPVLIDDVKTHPNVTTILWAGLPGQESGNSLTDVLYGKVNPQGRSPFTWGKAAGDWGITTIVNSSTPTPQQDFTEGSFIDYRYFDSKGIEPSFEFGYGLSYTIFSYTNLTVKKQDIGPYMPASGFTAAGPTFGGLDYDPAHALLPEGFEKVPGMIYPWIASTEIPDNTGSPDFPYAAHNRSAQPILPAGGAPGGNPELYKVVYIIEVDVTNSGEVPGTDIPQLYLSLGGPNEPKVVLRGFDEVELEAGETKTVTFNVTYRDLSNWDTEAQDWKVTSYPKTAYVGSSSRDLRLHTSL